MLVFKVLELLIDDEYAKLSDFVGCFQSPSFRYDTVTSLYSYHGEIVENKFFFLACDYDGKQYSETVYNIDTDTQEQNPRKPNQIELKKQFFACYSEERRILFLSDYEKKGTLKRILKERLGKSIIIRESFTNIEAFANASKFLKTISFVQRNSLVTQQSDLFTGVVNPLGLDMPNKCYTRLDYGRAPQDLLKKAVENLGARRDRGEVENVVIVGLDADDVETKFNYESSIQRFELEISADETKRYDVESVIDALKRELVINV